MRPASVKVFRAVCLCLLLAACHKHVPVTALPPHGGPTPTFAPAPDLPPAPNITVPPAVVSVLDQADRAFSAGNYDEAARNYESYLRATPTGGQRDQAWFYLGLSYAMRPPASVDWTRAVSSLKQVVEGYPSSPFKAPATLILSLHSDADQLAANGKQKDQQLKQLSTELDRLKKIDAARKRP